MPNDTLQVQQLNKWDDVNNLIDIDTSGGSVSSHMVYFRNPDPRGLGRIEAQASVVFDSKIIGFTADYRLFGDSNYLFAPNLTYDRTDTKYGWSLEEAKSWTPLDEVTFISDNEIQLNFTTKSAIDGLRVFTFDSAKPVPEPVTILGSLTAIGFGSLFKRRHSQKNKQ